ESLQPDLQQVFVITGAGRRDSQYEALARSQFQSAGARLTITFLSGLPMAELERRLSALPARSIVFFVMFYEDGAGRFVRPLDVLQHITSIANVPTYSWVDSAMECGIVGGTLLNQSAQLSATGELALRVLAGEKPDRIPVSNRDLAVNEVDWRQLERWRIGE